MFFGLASGAVQVPGIQVDQVLADIESLNQAAFQGRYEVTAVSFHAYAHLVAIPGRLTSAFLALQLYDPSFDVEVMPFDQIQQAVAEGRVDAGLLIHEGQLTYHADGLRKVVDLGEWWYERTGGLPLPLGGNVIRRDLGPEVIRTVSTMLHDSIAHALSHRAAAVEYALQFGRGLNRRDTDTFVGMYVNQLTLDYGSRGRAALERFFDEAYEKRLIPRKVPVEFVGAAGPAGVA